MKRLLLFALLLFSFFTQAQIDIGIRAGAGLSKANISDVSSAMAAIQSIDDAGRELSFHGGAYLKVDLPFVFVQVEGIFNQLNQTATVDQGGTLQNIELDLSRIDIPILVGADLGPLRMMLGPVYSNNLSDLSGVIGEDIESGTWGYQLGLGIEISKLIIDLRYEGAFSPWASQILVDQVGSTGTTVQTDLRSSQIMLCLGFELF